MKGFNIGDVVWFFWTDCGKYVFKEGGTGVFTDHIYLECGTIVGACEKKDYVHVYISGEMINCNFGYCFIDDYIFKTKHMAIDAMRKRLDMIEIEE